MLGQDCQFPKYAIRRESCSDVGGDTDGGDTVGVGATGIGTGGGFPSQCAFEAPLIVLKLFCEKNDLLNHIYVESS